MIRLPGVWARTADRLARGSGLLAHRHGGRLARWVRRARRDDLTGVRAALGPLLRLGLLLVAAWLVYQLVRALPWLMWALTGWWCWASWRATRPVPAPASVEQPPAGHQDGPTEDPLLLLLGQLLGTARGVHLVTVLEHLHKAGAAPSWTVSTLGREVERRGVPVRASVKVGGRVRKGVHREDYVRAVAALRGASSAALAAGGPGEVATPSTTALTCDDDPAATPVATPFSTGWKGHEKGSAAYGTDQQPTT